MPKRPTIKNVRWHGGQYWFRAKLGGESVVKPLGTNPTEARRLAFLYRQELDSMREQGKKLPGKVAELMEHWLTLYVPRNRVSRDHKMIRARMESHVLPVIGKVRLHEIRKRDLTELAVSLADKGLAVNTQRHILSDVRCAFNWALDEEMVETNPFVGRRILPAMPKHAPKPLTDEELEAVLSASREPYRSAINLAVRTGLRWGEQRALTWRHAELDTAEPSLTVERAKGGRPRRIPLDTETVKILQRWRVETTGVFVQPWRPQNAQRAAINSSDSGVKWHWHQLRHTFATQYLRDGGSIEALSKLLGHSEVRTTEIYGAVEERLIRADFARVRGQKLATKLAATAR